MIQIWVILFVILFEVVSRASKTQLHEGDFF